MALLGTNLKQSEVVVLVESIQTVISDYRMKESQKELKALRDYNDARANGDVEEEIARLLQKKEMHQYAATQHHLLHLEVKQILESLGIKDVITEES